MTATSTDTFQGFVYHIDESDTFIRIAYGAAAEDGDWVVTGREDEDTILLAQYTGQRHLGLVVILDFYPLTESEQWTPHPPSRTDHRFPI
jgi:hypothetical protein